MTEITKAVRQAKRLTARQKTFLAKYISFIEKGDTITNARIKAYRIAYDKKHMPKEEARRNSWYVLRYVTKKQEVADILARFGLDINRFAIELSNLLEAKKPIYYMGKKIAEEPDNRTRAVALSLFGNVLGLTSNRQTVDVNVNQSRSIIIEVMPEDVARQKANEIDHTDYFVREEEIKQRLLASDGD